MQLLRRRRRTDAEVGPQPLAERLVDAERLGSVPLPVGRLHQKPVPRLAIRLEPDEFLPGPSGARKLGAAECQARRTRAFERTDPKVVETPSCVFDPGEIFLRQEGAARDMQRDTG